MTTMTMPFLLDENRCQGRTARSHGQAVLCVECTDCRRRTDTEPGVSYTWIAPPRIAHVWLGCPMHVGPDIEVVVLP